MTKPRKAIKEKKRETKRLRKQVLAPNPLKRNRAPQKRERISTKIWTLIEKVDPLEEIRGKKKKRFVLKPLRLIRNCLDLTLKYIALIKCMIL